MFKVLRFLRSLFWWKKSKNIIELRPTPILYGRDADRFLKQVEEVDKGFHKSSPKRDLDWERIKDVARKRGEL